MNNEKKGFWGEHKKEMDMMKKRRRFCFYRVIKELRQMGFGVKELSPYQYRIADWLDIYPSNKRFHNLKTGKRGDIRGISIKDFLHKKLGLLNNKK